MRTKPQSAPAKEKAAALPSAARAESGPAAALHVTTAERGGEPPPAAGERPRGSLRRPAVSIYTRAASFVKLPRTTFFLTRWLQYLNISSGISRCNAGQPPALNDSGAWPLLFIRYRIFWQQRETPPRIAAPARGTNVYYKKSNHAQKRSPAAASPKFSF